METDVAVVGGGVSGLACARALAAAGLAVRVLEARRVGSGASGRNGGFAVRGLALPYSERPAADLWRATEEGVRRVSELAGEAFRPAGSLALAASGEEEAALRAEHDALRADGFAAELVGADELPPLLAPHFRGGLLSPGDGLLEPGRWARGLAGLAADAGAAIAEETRARHLDGTRVVTERGAVSARHVVVATDGYTDGLLPELAAAIVPARAQVLATEPLPVRHFEPALSARAGMDYCQQTREGRLVIGGWRDSELEAEFTTSEEPTESIQQRIEAFLARLLGQAPAITHRWAGLLGFTPDRLPLAGRLPGRGDVWAALGYSGHGNVLALLCGEAVAGAILGRPDPRLAPLSPERIPALEAPA